MVTNPNQVRSFYPDGLKCDQINGIIRLQLIHVIQSLLLIQVIICAVI